MTYNIIQKVGKNRIVSTEVSYNTIGEFGIDHEGKRSNIKKITLKRNWTNDSKQ